MTATLAGLPSTLPLTSPFLEDVFFFFSLLFLLEGIFGDGNLRQFKSVLKSEQQIIVLNLGENWEKNYLPNSSAPKTEEVDSDRWRTEQQFANAGVVHYYLY